MDPARRITLVSLVPTMLARLLDAGLERPPTLRWALLGGGPIPPRAARARGGRGRAGRADVRHDRGLLADRHVRLAAAGVELRLGATARSRSAARSSPPARWTTTAGCTPATSARSTTAVASRSSGRKSDTIITGGENVAPARGRGGAARAIRRSPTPPCSGVADPEWGEARRRAGRASGRRRVDAERAARVLRASGSPRFKVPKTIEFVDALPAHRLGQAAAAASYADGRCATARACSSRRGSPPNQLTIEQLAAETGMSVRNIRSHQARGLLAPPEVRMRVGYYGPEHVAPAAADPRAPGPGLQPRRDQAAARGHARHGRAAAARPAVARRAADDEPHRDADAVELGQRFRLEPEEGRQLLDDAVKLGILIPLGRRPVRGAESIAAGGRRRGGRAAGSRCEPRWRSSPRSSATATPSRARS